MEMREMRMFGWLPRAVLLLPLSLLLRPALHAQDGMTESGSVEAGVRALAGNRDSSQFNEYRDLRPGVFLKLFDLRLDHLFRKNYFLELQSRDSVLKDQSYRLAFGAYGKFHFDILWNEIPHDFTNTAISLFQQSSPGVFVFPAGQRTILQSSPASLPSVLSGSLPLDMTLLRKQGSETLQYTPTASWILQLLYSRETQNGYRPIGTILNSSNNNLELPEPIHYQTQEAEAGVEYGASRGGIQASFSDSIFSNQVGELVWDNPFRTTDASGNSSRGRIDLYPDNNAQSLNVAGAFNLSGSTRLMGSVSSQWMQQNDGFLPFTINSALTGLPQLPATSLNGSKQRLAMNYTVASHPLHALSLTARYRSYDYGNDTPSLTFPGYVQTDSSVSTLARQSLPYSYNRQNLELEAAWLLHKGERLTFGYVWEGLDRQHRDVANSREHTGSVKLDLNPKKWFTFQASYRRAERNPRSYVPNEEIDPLGAGAGAVSMPAGWQNFDEAARSRNQADATVQVDAGDRLSFSANAGSTQDRYVDSLYGLLSSRAFDTNLDAIYQLTPDLSLSADYTYETYKSDQRSRQYSAASNTTNNDWESYLRDGVHTVGGGISASHLLRNLTLDAFYDLAIAKGLTTTRALGNPALAGFLVTTAQDYPQTSNRFHELTATAKYQWTAHVFSSLQYRYERYDRMDFQIQNMAPSMVPFDPRTNTSIYLGADVPGYQVHNVSVTVEYRF
jgi:MtrB/PioB family decaheme-associated outer membrane protein